MFIKLNPAVAGSIPAQCTNLFIELRNNKKGFLSSGTEIISLKGDIMKKCSKCNVIKEEDEFHVKNKKTQLRTSWCKSCVYLLQRTRWTHRKKKAVMLCGGKCCKCGYDRNFSALHFHHTDQSKKEFSWIKARLYSWDKVLEELKKCILVCANCHFEIHYPECVLDGIITQADSRLNKEGTISTTGKCKNPKCLNDVFGTTFCSQECVAYASRRVERPTMAQLEEDMKTLPMTQIGKKYNVSDNAVRKWIKNYISP